MPAAIQTLALACHVADDEAFAPYGRIVRRPETTTRADLASGAVESWRLPFASASPPEVMFNRYHDRGRTFSVMEKHLDVTQCFFPLGGVSYIMVVGRDTAAGGFEPAQVEAFHVPGHHGVLLWRGVWHALARFPVDAPYIDFAFITDARTQAEIEAHLSGGDPPQRTAFIDFATTHSTVLQVMDPPSAVARELRGGVAKSSHPDDGEPA